MAIPDFSSGAARRVSTFHARLRNLCTAVAALGFGLAAAPALHGQVAGSLDPAFLPDVGADYVVATAVQPDGKIVIGGVFTSVNGETRNRIARLNPDGSLESTNTFNPGSGVAGTGVGCIAVQADGRIVIAGNFSSVDGQPRGGIARLNPDGTLESTATFNAGSGANDQVVGMALQPDGKILIGGFFTSVNGQPRSALARLNTNGTVESTATFNPGAGVGGEVPLVRSIAVQADGKILIGGYFTSVGGQPRTNMARLHENGIVESLSGFGPTSTDGWGVDSIRVQANGWMIIGGNFATVNDEPRQKIARLTPRGTLEEAFAPALGGGVDGVYSVALQVNGKLLIAGDFTSVNGAPRNRVARLEADGSLESLSGFDMGGGIGGDVPLVFDVAQQADGKILLGGFFTAVDGQPRGRLARLANDAAPQRVTIPIPQQVLWVREGAAPELDQVEFHQSTDGGTTWTSLGEARRMWLGWECFGVELTPGGLVRARGRTISGNANASSGLVEQIVPVVIAPDIAVEIPLEHGITNGSSQPFGAVATNGESSLSFYLRNSGNVYMTGISATIDGPDANAFTLTTEPPEFLGPGEYDLFIVKFSPTNTGNKTATLHIASNDPDENPFEIVLTGSAQETPVAGSVDSTFNPDLSGYVQATAVQPDGKTVVGGNFLVRDRDSQWSIARLNPDGSMESTNTFNPGTGIDGELRSVAVQADGRILVGGSFQGVNGEARQNIARLAADGRLEDTNEFRLGSGTDNQIIALAVQPDGKMLIAGYCTVVDGQPRHGIARLLPDGSLESTNTFNTGSGADAGILGVAVQPDGKIVIVGDFTTIDGQPRSGIARLHADGSLESTNTFYVGTGAGGDFPAPFCVALQADGKILVGGYFTSIDGQPRNRIARLNPDGTLEATNTFAIGSGANDVVNSVALQADGKILLAGYFTIVDGLPRGGIARLLPDGTVESTATFNTGTGADASASGVMLDAEGRILLVGAINRVNEQPRPGIARLVNDAATQSLSLPSRTHVVWQRGGAAPEVEQTTLEISTDDGASWSAAGAGNRIAGGWEWTGVDAPVRGLIRARGRTIGATFSGSSGLLEHVAPFNVGPRALLEAVLAELTTLRAGATDRNEIRKLDLAIKHLTRALAADLWLDEERLDKKRGQRVFQEAGSTVSALCALAPRDSAPSATHSDLAARIFAAERLLATAAIDEATRGGASSRRIEQATGHRARGDVKIAEDPCQNASRDYRLAWQRAARAETAGEIDEL